MPKGIQMGLLLKIIGAIWAITGVVNIFMSPLFPGGTEAGILALLMYNALLFILPGMGVYALGVVMAKKMP
jgi:hypothetical protein